MTNERRRPCPICGGVAGAPAFPYATLFNEERFDYLRCRSCGSVFVDPVPSDATFSAMYAKAAYHDEHYLVRDGARYAASAQLLRSHLSEGARVLDYGCGLGGFMTACRAEGLSPEGVEFDEDAARHAAAVSGCPTISVAKFEEGAERPLYDALHLGDVLEHLPDPAATLRDLLAHVRPGGLLFAEGPLEINPSPVIWAASSFGALRRALGMRGLGATPPTHLMRVDSRRQKEFFNLVDPSLALVHWDLKETGWPYANGGAVKRAIASVARAIGGRTILGIQFGNRFRGIYLTAGGNATEAA